MGRGCVPRRHAVALAAAVPFAACQALAQPGAALQAAMQALRTQVPVDAAYVAESDYFETDWQQRYRGPQDARLLATKQRVDPDGLFTHHHGVGSEFWSADGFTRRG